MLTSMHCFLMYMYSCQNPYIVNYINLFAQLRRVYKKNNAMFTKSCPEVCVSIIFLILLVFKHIRWVSDLRFWLGKTHSRIQCYYSRVGLGLTLLELLIFHWFYKHLEVYFRSCYSRVRPYYSRVGFLVSCLLKKEATLFVGSKAEKKLAFGILFHDFNRLM